MAGGIKVGVTTKGLTKLLRNLSRTKAKTKPLIADGLNEVGDGVVSLVANSIAKQTGLTLGEVRSAMTIRRASASGLSFSVKLERSLVEDPRSLEGRRENEAFGRRRAGTLVVVVSRKDELVCMDCQELEAAGPMPVEIAMAHIPKHPNCRCIILPYVQKGRRMPVSMTTLGGTGKRLSVNNEMMTIRQLAKTIMEKAATNIKIELTKQ